MSVHMGTVLPVMHHWSHNQEGYLPSEGGWVSTQRVGAWSGGVWSDGGVWSEEGMPRSGSASRQNPFPKW